jgi:hypothetical protein
MEVRPRGASASQLPPPRPVGFILFEMLIAELVNFAS